MQKKLWLLSLIVTLLLATNFAFAQVGYSQRSLSTKIAGWWYFFLIIAFILVYLGIWSKKKWLVSAAAVLVLFGILLTELGLIIPLMKARPIVLYEECKGLTLSSKTYDIAGVISCILTGYAPVNAETLTIASFMIFGIIAPFAFLYAVVYYFSDFIADKRVRNVITFTITVMAFRGLFANFLIDLMTYGFTGIALLAVDIIIVGFVYRLAIGLGHITYYDAQRKTIMMQNLAQLNRLKEERENLLRARQEALAANDQAMVNEIDNKIKTIDKQIEALSKKVGKI